MSVLRGRDGSFRLLYDQALSQTAELGVCDWKLTVANQYQSMLVVTRLPGGTFPLRNQAPALARPFLVQSGAALEFTAHVDAEARWFQRARDWWSSYPWEGDLYLGKPDRLRDDGTPLQAGDPTPLIRVRGYLQNAEVHNHVRGVATLSVALALDRVELLLDKTKA